MWYCVASLSNVSELAIPLLSVVAWLSCANDAQQLLGVLGGLQLGATLCVECGELKGKAPNLTQSSENS